MGHPVVVPAATPLEPPESRPAQASSFEDFYRAQSDRVYRALAVTLGAPDLAREATDEAMARACARWQYVAELDNPGGWVYRVGLNWATSWWRKRRREQLRADPSQAHMGSILAPTDPEAATALAAMNELSTAHRAVIVCRVLLDLSVAETAAVLDIPPGTVRSRLSRALSILRINVKDWS